MAKKKFGASGLNSVDSAIETVSAAMTESQKSSQPVASAPVQSPEPEVIASPAIATKVEQTAQASAPVLKTEPSPGVVQPAIQPAPLQEQAKEEPAPEVKVENTKGLNIPLPISIYKRLSTMKINVQDETLKSLGLRAIIEFLDKNGH